MRPEYLIPPLAATVAFTALWLLHKFVDGKDCPGWQKKDPPIKGN